MATKNQFPYVEDVQRMVRIPVNGPDGRLVLKEFPERYLVGNGTTKQVNAKLREYSQQQRELASRSQYDDSYEPDDSAAYERYMDEYASQQMAIDAAHGM